MTERVERIRDQAVDAVQRGQEAAARGVEVAQDAATRRVEAARLGAAEAADRAAAVVAKVKPRLRGVIHEYAFFAAIALGGAHYTTGAVIYATGRPDPRPQTFGYHEIFHTLVTGAAGAHYAVIAFAVLPFAK